eukprot:TRINITY_DN102941_c0_g1_i1.p1 TRINITY_DN102941_c0_g1~~TRINITY_DN102941_c0_g1_i1.p1  ORF type:complete len:636 (-),score=74.90 TRINITY_DN102941_c0_g1_i1:58-1965(-)
MGYPSPDLCPGTDVELASGRATDRYGTITRCVGDGEIEILFWSGKVEILKAASVTKIGCDPNDTWLASQDGKAGVAIHDSWGPELLNGTVVDVTGLSSDAGKKLNGKTGVVSKFCAEKSRYEVRFTSGDTASLKIDNLTVPELQLGDKVEILGLESASGKQMNGEKGTIQTYVESTSRFQVKLSAEKTVSLKPDNLKRLPDNQLLNLLQDLCKSYGESKQIKENRMARLSKSDVSFSDAGALKDAIDEAQMPVFSRHGWPAGRSGVNLMKIRMRRAVFSGDASVARVARDMCWHLGVMPLPHTAGKHEDAGGLNLETQHALRNHSVQMAWRKVGHAIASAGMPALRKQYEEMGAQVMPSVEKDSDAQVREQLFESCLKKARNIALVDLQKRNPAWFGPGTSEWRNAWADDVCKESHVTSLINHGWVVLDGVLESDLVAAAVSELRDLQVNGNLIASTDPCNRGAKAISLNFASNESRAHSRLCYPSLYEISRRLCGLPDVLSRCDSTGRLLALRTNASTMVSVYEPGIAYRPHLDSYGGRDSLRMVTCLAYLNDTDFSEADGGAIRLYKDLASANTSTPPAFASPHASQEPDGPREDIAPISGRVLLFLSREVWHAVLPARRDRYAMTLWVPSSE